MSKAMTKGDARKTFKSTAPSLQQITKADPGFKSAATPLLLASDWVAPNVLSISTSEIGSAAYGTVGASIHDMQTQMYGLLNTLNALVGKAGPVTQGTQETFEGSVQKTLDMLTACENDEAMADGNDVLEQFQMIPVVSHDWAMHSALINSMAREIRRVNVLVKTLSDNLMV